MDTKATFTPTPKTASRKVAAVGYVLAVALWSSACTHVGPLTELPLLASADSQVFVSSTRYEDGAIRRAVVERVFLLTDNCERIEVTRYDYTRDGTLIQRRFEQRRCGNVDLAIVDRFDPSSRTLTTVALRDEDHDGAFDAEQEFSSFEIDGLHAKDLEVLFAAGLIQRLPITNKDRRRSAALDNANPIPE